MMGGLFCSETTYEQVIEMMKRECPTSPNIRESGDKEIEEDIN